MADKHPQRASVFDDETDLDLTAFSPKPADAPAGPPKAAVAALSEAAGFPARSATTPSVPTKVLPASKTAGKKAGDPKPEPLVRDGYTMPASEHAGIEALQLRALSVGRLKLNEATKSLIVRAGIKALADMTDVQFAKAIGAVDVLKTGRPKD